MIKQTASKIKLVYPTSMVTLTPSSSNEDFLKVIDQILAHGKENGISYEVMKLAGDVYLTPVKKLEVK